MIVKISLYKCIQIAFKHNSWPRFVSKMAAIINSSDSDSEFIGFSAEDVSLANEKYDRIVQIENEDISDLDISDFSSDEDENEESEVDDPDFDQQVDAGQQLFVWFLLFFVIYLPQYILNMHKKIQKLWINNKKVIVFLVTHVLTTGFLLICLRWHSAGYGYRLLGSKHLSGHMAVSIERVNDQHLWHVHEKWIWQQCTMIAFVANHLINEWCMSGVLYSMFQNITLCDFLWWHNLCWCLQWAGMWKNCLVEKPSCCY